MALSQNFRDFAHGMEESHGLIPDAIHLHRASRNRNTEVAWVRERVAVAMAPIDPGDYAVHTLVCDFAIDVDDIFALRIVFAIMEDTTQTSARPYGSRLPTDIAPRAWGALSTAGHQLAKIWEQTKAPVGDPHELKFLDFSYATRKHQAEFAALHLHPVAVYFLGTPADNLADKTHRELKRDLTVY